MNPEQEFVNLISDIGKKSGLGELSSRILGLLYLEPEEVSLPQLAKRTGYSMAAISTEMKFLVASGMVKRVKKPGSKKVYFYMEKNLIKMLKQSFQKRYEVHIPLAKEKLPGIIRELKKGSAKGRSPKQKEMLKVIEDYYQQVLKMERVLEKMLKELDKLNGMS